MILRPSLRALVTLTILTGSVGAVMPAFAEAPVYRNVTNVAPGHVAWMYAHPNSASARVGYLKAGALRVRTMNCRHLAKGGWCQVMRRGTRGWVQDRFLKPDTIMRG